MMLLPEAKIDVVAEKTRADTRYDISRRFISPVINNPKRSDVQHYYGNTILLYTPFHDRKWEDGRIKNIH